MSTLDSAEYRMLETLVDQRLRLTQENLHLMERFSGGMQGTHGLQKELLRAELGREFRQSYQQEHGAAPKDKLVDEAIAITPRYIEFVEVTCQERQAWLDLKEQLAALSFKIRFLLKSDNQSVDAPSPVEDDVATDDA